VVFLIKLSGFDPANAGIVLAQPISSGFAVTNRAVAGDTTGKAGATRAILHQTNRLIFRINNVFQNIFAGIDRLLK